MQDDASPLTKSEFWNNIYRERQSPSGRNETLTYPHKLLWEDILPAEIGAEGGSVIEIGSAPGTQVVRFARLFRHEPFGLEYAEAGVAQNRAYFAENGFDPGNVIHADLFDDAELAPLEGKFDAVISFGFVEHFGDPSDAVARHIRLCKPGGLIVVTVPNMRGFNWLTMRLFEPQIEPFHNLELMTPKALAALLDRPDVERRFAGYYGGYNFTNRKVAGGWRRLAALVMMNVAPLLHATLDRLRPRRFETATFSPYIAFVGRRRPD